MYNKDDAKRNRITKRVRHIVMLVETGKISFLRNYISDCMESDIRREKKANKELLSILNKDKKEYLSTLMRERKEK